MQIPKLLLFVMQGAILMLKEVEQTVNNYLFVSKRFYS
jgi:hypothetical protein